MQSGLNSNPSLTGPLFPNERRNHRFLAIKWQPNCNILSAIKDEILITVSFVGQELHDGCTKLDKAELAFGSLNAGALITFISEARAFENVQELLDLLGDQIKILADDSLSVSIGSDYVAALVAVGTRFKRDANGRVIWSSVKALKLVTISRLP